MSQLVTDLRYAVRSLARSPLFAGVAILTLGLGIGANTAIFSVVNGVLLEPLRYNDPGRLVSLKTQFPTMGFDRFWVSPPEYYDLQEWSRSFQAIGAYRTGSTSINADERPLRVTSAVASHELFRVLGVDAARGRYFTQGEDLPGGDPATVISHGLWTRAFGEDPEIVGRTVLLDGSAATVVGVMPEGFDVDDAGVDVWQPLQLDPADPGGRGSHYLYLIGRLAPGVTLERAETELATLVSSWSERVPGTHTPSPDGHPFVMASLQQELTGPVRSQLWILLGAVGFVLLIACANVGNLLLARSETRQKEVAVRTALGAPRSRLVRQFLTESVLLSLLGGVAGIVIATVGLRLLLAFSSGSIPRLGEIQLDATVLGLTLVVAIGTGLVFGLAPILHLSGSTSGGLRDGGRGSTAGRGRQRVRQALVVAEVALAVILVVGSGLMLRSFQALMDVDPGFRAEEMLTWQMRLPVADYPEPDDQVAFYRTLKTNLEATPGVIGMAAMSGLPPRRSVNANDTEFEGVERTQDGPAHNVDYYQFVTTDYFEVMEIALVEGRAFNSSDEISDLPVALVNERLVRTFYEGQSPIGRRVRPSGGGPWVEIVGVVRDVKQGGLEEETGTELYFNFVQVAGFAPRNMNVALRTRGEPTAVMNTARAEVGRLDETLPLANLQSMEANMAGSLARPRFLTLLLGIFAGLALTLAAVGTYGVVSYFVAERNREIGIRMAMGAQPGAVLALVLRHGGSLAVGGLVVGLLGAYSLSRLMRSLVFGVATTDLTTYVAAPAVLAVVALLACWLPARRATRVDPAIVLRQD